MREFYNGLVFGESALSHRKLFLVQKKRSLLQREIEKVENLIWTTTISPSSQDLLFLDLWNRFPVHSGVTALTIPFLSFCSSWVWYTGRDSGFRYVCKVCIRSLWMGRIYPGICEIPKSMTNILTFKFHMYYEPECTWKHLFSPVHYSCAFSSAQTVEEPCFIY